MSIDLDELARLNAERTQGEWSITQGNDGLDIEARDADGYTAIALDVRIRDARAICAAVNALPALLRVARAAAEWVDCDDLHTMKAKHDAVVAAVRAMREVR